MQAESGTGPRSTSTTQRRHPPRVPDAGFGVPYNHPAAAKRVTADRLRVMMPGRAYAERAHGLPDAAMAALTTTSRDDLRHMLQLYDCIDLVIPRERRPRDRASGQICRAGSGLLCTGQRLDALQRWQPARPRRRDRNQHVTGPRLRPDGARGAHRPALRRDRERADALERRSFLLQSVTVTTASASPARRRRTRDAAATGRRAPRWLA